MAQGWENRDFSSPLLLRTTWSRCLEIRTSYALWCQIIDVIGSMKTSLFGLRSHGSSKESLCFNSGLYPYPSTTGRLTPCVNHAWQKLIWVSTFPVKTNFPQPDLSADAHAMDCSRPVHLKFVRQNDCNVDWAELVLVLVLCWLYLDPHGWIPAFLFQQVDILCQTSSIFPLLAKHPPVHYVWINLARLKGSVSQAWPRNYYLITTREPHQIALRQSLLDQRSRPENLSILMHWR